MKENIFLKYCNIKMRKNFLNKKLFDFFTSAFFLKLWLNIVPYVQKPLTLTGIVYTIKKIIIELIQFLHLYGILLKNWFLTIKFWTHIPFSSRHKVLNIAMFFSAVLSYTVFIFSQIWHKNFFFHYIHEPR